MQTNNFNENVIASINLARNIAIDYKHEQLAVEHLVKAFLSDKDELIVKLITLANGRISHTEAMVNKILSKLPKNSKNKDKVYLTVSLDKILGLATLLSEKDGNELLSTEYILLAITRDDLAKKLINVTSEAFEEAIQAFKMGRSKTNLIDITKYESLNKFTSDLTAKAASGILDPMIGRDEEVKRMIQILSRRSKNNPVLIGESGVGKTAIANGLATKIVNNDVPDNLKNKRLLALDLGTLVAGAKYRGELEERINAILVEIKEVGNIILFIDELHTLVNASKSDGGTDISGMLKPALASGELHCLGASTLEGYSRNIEKDPALARRFQSIFVEEPSINDTITILRGIKDKFEIHHGVRIMDSALTSAVTLSKRYVPDRFLPDKAIDLVDEAASFLRIQIDSKPEDIDNIERKIIQLKLESEILKKEKSDNNRLVTVDKEILQLEKDLLPLTTAWNIEKINLQKVQLIKTKLNRAKSKLDDYLKEGDLEKASRIRHSIIPKLEVKLNKYNDVLNNIQAETVTEEHIGQIIAKWTGIPVTKLAGEKEKILSIEEHLTRRVIGQPAAVNSISQAIKRARAGLQDPQKPLGSFMFLGSSGVGKTELCKTLADFLFDDENAIVRIDMSEFGEKHTVSRLLGAPPGYVGYEEGGALTEPVRQRPYQIVLFDEIEKAHPDIFNILLQVLDDGRLTDGQGRVVDFKNTIIAMTSNLGSKHIKVGAAPEEYREDVMKVVKGHFRPEFLNRIDEILIFEHLSLDDMKKIVTIQLNRINSFLKDRKIKIELDQASFDWLAKEGYDPVYGVRPLKRVMQQYLQNPLSDEILNDRIKDGDTIIVTKLDGGPIKFELEELVESI